MAITDVPGIRVGHWTEAAAKTGCTVVLMPAEGAVAGVDVRGSAPGTRETDLLRPGMLVERVHAIALCGGSAFGLAVLESCCPRTTSPTRRSPMPLSESMSESFSTMSRPGSASLERIRS